MADGLRGSWLGAEIGLLRVKRTSELPARGEEIKDCWLRADIVFLHVERSSELVGYDVRMA